MAAKKKPGGAPIPAEKKAKVLDEYKRLLAAGENPSIGTFAKRFGIHGSTLGIWLRAEGLYKPRKYTPPGNSPNDTPGLAKARGIHHGRLKTDPEYRAQFTQRVLAGKAAKAAERGNAQLVFPAVANGHGANGHMVTPGDEGELDYLREALRVALREREALRITLDIVMREQHTAQGRAT